MKKENAVSIGFEEARSMRGEHKKDLVKKGEASELFGQDGDMSPLK